MLRRQGLSIRKIAALRGVSRNAVRRALRSSTAPTGKRRRTQDTKLAPFYDQIAAWLRDPVKSLWTGARMLDELHDRGYTGSRTVLLDHLRRMRAKAPAQAEARFYVKPGQQVQIDWGEMGVVPIDGVMTKVYAFVAVLAWSRVMFIRFTADMELLTWLDCHRHAFAFFGGVPCETLIDNLKTGVLSRAGGTVKWHPKYNEFAVAHGFFPIAHFPKRPKTKGRVERMVGFVRSRFFVGRDIIDLDRVNADAIEWLQGRANRRVHRTIGERPCVRFATEAGMLLPLVPFDVMLEEPRVADSYALVSWNGVRYSIPSECARRPVVLQRRAEGLTFVVSGAVVARHAYAKPGVRLVQDPAHLPPRPRPRHERFVELGDRVVAAFGELGRQYVDQVERRAPHAPLAILREILERQAEFGKPIVAASLESLLQFNVIQRGKLSRLCYGFGTIPTLSLAANQKLPEVEVERRALSAYDEAVA